MTPRLKEQMQIFYDTIIWQFPEGTWAHRKQNQIYVWPESLVVMLEFKCIERGLLAGP